MSVGIKHDTEPTMRKRRDGYGKVEMKIVGEVVDGIAQVRMSRNMIPRKRIT